MKNGPTIYHIRGEGGNTLSTIRWKAFAGPEPLPGCSDQVLDGFVQVPEGNLSSSDCSFRLGAVSLPFWATAFGFQLRAFGLGMRHVDLVGPRSDFSRLRSGFG